MVGSAGGDRVGVLIFFWLIAVVEEDTGESSRVIFCEGMKDD